MTAQDLAAYLDQAHITLDVSAGVYRRQVFNVDGQLFPRVLDWEYMIWSDEELEGDE